MPLYARAYLYSYRMFTGIESLSLSSEDTVEARRQVPKGMLVSVSVVSVLSILQPLVVRKMRRIDG